MRVHGKVQYGVQKTLYDRKKADVIRFQGLVALFDIKASASSYVNFKRKINDRKNVVFDLVEFEQEEFETDGEIIEPDLVPQS